MVEFCESNDLKCGRFDSKGETVEFYCENYKKPLPADCKTSLLKWIDTCDKSTVKQLKIGGCNPMTVAKILGDFVNVVSLDISQSGYETLDSFELKHQHLMKVIASHNLLSKIPKNFFTYLPSVDEVDFSYNELKNYTFIQLPVRSKTVHLAHNQITDGDFGEKLRKLEYLDLSYNSLKFLSYISIASKHLKTFLLNDNPITKFECAILQLVEQGTSVYISWQHIEMFKFVCMKKSFNVIMNSPNEGFFYTSNGQIEMHCNEQSFGHIESFEMSGGHFEHNANVTMCLTSSLRKLDLSKNNVKNLNFMHIQRFYNLEHFNLNDTQLTEFDFNWITNQTHLKSLYISHNNLTKLKNVSLLKTFTELDGLRLEGNMLENAHEVIQHLNSAIKYLYLYGNHFGQVNDATFEKLTNLRHLGLDNTKLSFVTSSPFKKLNKLIFLEIGANNLDTVDLTAIPGEHLYKLDLYGNNLTKLENLTPLLFPALKIISISNNLFPCDYLQTFIPRVEVELDGLHVDEDAWKQKYGQDCNSSKLCLASQF